MPLQRIQTERMMRKVVAYVAAVLCVAEVLLVLMSWLLSATMATGVRSLLSSEGIRFFFGGFVQMLSKPLLLWLLLLSMAWGCMRSSGLRLLFSLSDRHYRRQALMLLVVIVVAYGALLLWLTAMPQAVLLSATGKLWPSPFSRALVPIVAFGLILISMVYGMVSRRFLSMADICEALSSGIAQAAPLFMLYVLSMQLYATLRFVFF